MPTDLSGPLKDLFEAFPALGKKWTSRAYTLSGGQQRMLALVLVLARSLNGNRTQSPLLILDEPTMGLQPNLTEITLGTIQ